MEENRFDRLARQVGAQTDRRTMLKSATGGGLALLALGALAHNDADARNKNKHKNNHKRKGRGGNTEGYDGDACDVSDDCEKGLRCEGSNTGLLGGIGGNYGPSGVDLPILTGKSGRCRYKKSCGGQKGDACQNNSDCCNGDNLTCKNHKCKSK